MKLCCISDLHGYLPKLDKCDAVLIAGDICPLSCENDQLDWLLTTFRRWLLKIYAPVIYCPGNHDWPLYHQATTVLNAGLKWIYLQDDLYNLNGVKIWGTPWTKKFLNWAFMREESELKNYWNMMPLVDIILCHSPPFGYGDITSDRHKIGSLSLLTTIEKIQPKYVVFGHNHNGYGQYSLGNTTLLNCSLRNDNYDIVNPPTYIECDAHTKT
jgi:Icc-related predicted phosphoesterase